MVSLMPFTLDQIENLRSVAMIAPDAPSGLSCAKALEVLTELANVTAERDRLYAELIAAGLVAESVGDAYAQLSTNGRVTPLEFIELALYDAECQWRKRTTVPRPEISGADSPGCFRAVKSPWVHHTDICSHSVAIPRPPVPPPEAVGRVAERSNVPVSKTGACDSAVGSNPTPAASY
jgi:hypothetical protein